MYFSPTIVSPVTAQICLSVQPALVILITISAFPISISLSVQRPPLLDFDNAVFVPTMTDRIAELSVLFLIVIIVAGWMV